ncbi:MAG: hypothetical protein WC421_04320 [Elusimicrobiales bacterium]
MKGFIQRLVQKQIEQLGRLPVWFLWVFIAIMIMSAYCIYWNVERLLNPYGQQDRQEQCPSCGE